MLRRMSIGAFVIRHTRLIQSAHRVHRIQICDIEILKNILKNILKTFQIRPSDEMLNTLFQFAHIREGAKVTST